MEELPVDAHRDLHEMLRAVQFEDLMAVDHDKITLDKADLLPVEDDAGAAVQEVEDLQLLLPGSGVILPAVRAVIHGNAGVLRLIVFFEPELFRHSSSTVSESKSREYRTSCPFPRAVESAITDTGRSKTRIGMRKAAFSPSSLTGRYCSPFTAM